MKPKIPKCCSMAVQASKGQVYDPQLSLCGQTIPFIGTSTFKFLGAPVTIHDSQDKAKSALLEKLHTMLSKVDTTLLSSRQKLRLFRDAVCPRLTWDLPLANLPISWVGKNLDTLATKFLKPGQQLPSLSAKEQRWPPDSIHLNHFLEDPVRPRQPL